MKPDKATVYEIFQMEKRYVVPLYQRPYVWKIDEQWAPLWEDIETKAIGLARGEAQAPHFLGAIVLSQIKIATRDVAASQIIDGQQRLTTLQIFLAALRDNVAELAEREPDETAKATLSKVGKKLSDLTEHSDVLGAKEDRFKVWPTKSDRGVFEGVMSAGSRTALDARYPVQYTGSRRKTPVTGPRLVEAYRFFDSSIRQYVSEAARPADGALALFDAIRQCLQLVVIDLEEGDDPQVIFETLNATGAPLLPSDLIRNLVFTRAGADGDTLYESHWRVYDENNEDGTAGFWKQLVKQGREHRPLLDLFFQHYLSCRTERMVALGHLYDEFRSWWRDKDQAGRSVAGVLDEVARFSSAYRQFYEPEMLRRGDPRLASFASRLIVLDTTTVYPVLLYLVVEAEERIGRTARDEMLRDLESFLVRRWVCGVTTKGYNRLFAALLHDLRSADVPDPAMLRTRLSAGSGVDRWPDDKEFEAAWLRESVYERLKSPGVQVVLGAIHEDMLTKKQEPLSLPRTLTVEHVMPRAWRNHWPPPQAAAEGGDESPEERRDRIIHTFGNLTLLTQELNAEVRDGPFERKKVEITEQSLLLLNAYFQKTETWDEEAILKRARELFGRAMRIWPHPTSGAIST